MYVKCREAGRLAEFDSSWRMAVVCVIIEK